VGVLLTSLVCKGRKGGRNHSQSVSQSVEAGSGRGKKSPSSHQLAARMDVRWLVQTNIHIGTGGLVAHRLPEGSSGQRALYVSLT
jgi:hypothetical protein